jgi:hypothetical protein
MPRFENIIAAIDGSWPHRADGAYPPVLYRPLPSAM